MHSTMFQISVFSVLLWLFHVFNENTRKDKDTCSELSMFLQSSQYTCMINKDHFVFSDAIVFQYSLFELSKGIQCFLDRQKYFKNQQSHIMPIPLKATAIQPPTTHCEKKKSETNQTCRTLLEKQGRAHK